MLTTMLSLALLVVPPQEPPGDERTPARLVERFERLPADRRDLVLRNIERRLARENGDVLQRIQSRQRGASAYPQQPAPTWFLPADYAPVAAERHLVPRTDPVHQRATAKMASLVFLPDLHAEVVYDWRLGKAARNGKTASDVQRFANLAHGYVPCSDHAVAQVLEALDTDPTQRALGDYFAHLYADRNGAVFADTTMFDAWQSGTVVEMPDTDAIAFARRILGTQSFVAPIPDDRRRSRLYRKVQEAFTAHREYRTLRLSIAVAFVAADPAMDPTYAPLVRRAHWLWHTSDYDQKELAARLAAAGDRTTLLDEIDAALQHDPKPADTARAWLQETRDFLRTLADHELSQANG
jgi:hypothetical protein